MSVSTRSRARLLTRSRVERDLARDEPAEPRPRRRRRYCICGSDRKQRSRRRRLLQHDGAFLGVAIRQSITENA